MRDPTNRASNIVAEVIDTRIRSNGGADLEMRGPPDWRPLRKWFGVEYVSNRELGEAELMQAWRQLKNGYISRLEIRTVTHHAERLRRCYHAAKLAPTLPADKILLVNLSGRGDKDMHTVAEKSGIEL